MKSFLEHWKPVYGYEGLYQVSDFGDVRSLNYRRTGQVIVLKPAKEKKGYLFVNLYKDGKQKHHKIHRLVASTFIPNPYNLPEVNHIDEDKTNNVVSNLEWCLHIDNVNHGTHNKRMAETLTNGKLSKKVLQLTLDGKIVREWASASECGRNGFYRSAVSACCRGERKTHKGYRWMYAEDFYNLIYLQ